MTFDPPSQPAAGWYDDPYRPGDQRWWDGRQWHERWLSDSHSTGDRFAEVGDWLGRSFSVALRRWKAVAVATALTTGLGSVLALAGFAYLFDGVVIFEDEVVGWSSDRLPLAIALFTIGIVLTMVGTLAIAALMLRTVDRDEQGGDVGAEASAAWWSIRRGFTVLPRAIGWSALLMLAVLAVMAVLIVVAVVVLPLGILLILAAVLTFPYVVVRLAFMVQAIVDKPGNPFRRSFEVSRDRFWPTFGRLLLLGVLVWLISIVVQAISGLLSGTGLQGFGQNGLVTEPDGTFVSVDVGEALTAGPWVLIVTMVTTVVSAVLTGGVAAAGFAILYRSRNKPDEPSVQPPLRQ